MILDQITDRCHVLLKDLFDSGVLPEFTKRASLDVDGLGDKAYADPTSRLFPIHTPEHTLISAAYFFKQAGQKQPGGDVIVEKLVKAAYAHEVEALLLKVARDLTSLEQPPPTQDPENYHLLLKQGGKVYGKFYAADGAGVKQAETHFMQNHHRYPVDWKVEVCRNLHKTASAHGVELNPLMRAYAGQNVCFSEKASEEIAKRAYFIIDDPEMATLYQKLAQVVPGSMNDPEVLEKLAYTLNLADKLTGLDKHYGRAFYDPYVTIFNMTEKAAQAALEVMDILGNQFTLDELIGMGPELYRRALGPEFVDAISKQGSLDPEAIKTVIPTLPRDEKAILVKFLKQAVDREDEDADLLRAISPA